MIFKKITLFIGLALFGVLITACEAENTESDSYKFPYTVNKPSEIRFLPAGLEEVSGLALMPETTHELACLQDEAGIVYIYNWLENKITRRINFQVYDDFEGIEIVGQDGFALTSNGDFYRIPGLNQQATKTKIKIDKDQDLEGLGYDADNNRLLILPKSEVEKGKLLIYQYDLGLKSFDKKPVLQVSAKAVKKYFAGKNIPYKGDKKQFPFRPSGIAVHPFTKNIYIIAAVGKTLCVLSPTGKILRIEQFSEAIYPQPEGITFFPNGDLVIASEGDKGKLILLKNNQLENENK